MSWNFPCFYIKFSQLKQFNRCSSVPYRKIIQVIGIITEITKEMKLQLPNLALHPGHPMLVILKLFFCCNTLILSIISCGILYRNIVYFVKICTLERWNIFVANQVIGMLLLSNIIIAINNLMIYILSKDSGLFFIVVALLFIQLNNVTLFFFYIQRFCIFLYETITLNSFGGHSPMLLLLFCYCYYKCVILGRSYDVSGFFV